VGVVLSGIEVAAACFQRLSGDPGGRTCGWVACHLSPVALHGSGGLLVDGEQVDGSGSVLGGGPGVDPGGFEAGVAEESRPGPMRRRSAHRG